MPDQWDRFVLPLASIDHRVGSDTFGVICNTDDAGTMDDELVVQPVAESTLGFVVGRAVAQFYEGALSQMTETLATKAFSQFLKDEEATQLTGRRSEPGTAVQLRLFYSPYTRYATAMIGSVCHAITPAAPAHRWRCW